MEKNCTLEKGGSESQKIAARRARITKQLSPQRREREELTITTRREKDSEKLLGS